MVGTLMMQKPRNQKKLTVRSQTIRQLSELDLTRAQGGRGSAVAFETEETCVTTAAQTPTVGCGPG
jgi:hypothetical protein